MGYYVDMEDPNTPERHINIHFSPEVMAGHYANFANVSHSDYEFTITFARVDHEIEDEEIPGVVVARINLSAKFMRELIDAMEDNYSKWKTREDIKSIPEYGGAPPPAGGDE
jgi:hemerythrin-like domain-containing protein